jgi:hypothetical protein
MLLEAWTRQTGLLLILASGVWLNGLRCLAGGHSAGFDDSGVKPAGNSS